MTNNYECDDECDDDRWSDADGLKAIEYVANYVARLGDLDPLDMTDVGVLMHYVHRMVGYGLAIEDLEEALKIRGLAPKVVDMVLSLWNIAVYSTSGPSKWRDVDILNE